MSDGSFILRGQEWSFTLLSAEGYDGQEWTGGDIEDNIDHADRVFYSVEDAGGEAYYRWLGGPFESLYDLESAIEDDVEAYE
jgi:hypothetical protein